MSVESKIQELLSAADSAKMPIDKLMARVLSKLEDTKADKATISFPLPTLTSVTFDAIITALSTNRELPGNPEKVVERINSAMINKDQPKFWRAVFILVAMNLARYRR